MKLLRKNFFDFFLSESQTYHIKSQSHPLWKAENPEQLESLTNGWHTEDFALPLFLRTPMKESPRKISYPPLATLEVMPSAFRIKPLESFLENKAEIILIDKSLKSWQLPLKSRGQESYNLNPLNYKKILLQQGREVWFLAQSPLSCEEKATPVYCYQNEPILSVKSFLDPDGGLERLMRDIQENNWPLPRKGEMLKLLKILQIATPQEELTILANIRKDDKNFYEILQQKLISPKLLPYMNRNEVSKILQNIDETTLQKALSQKEQQNFFRPFFSKNRFHSLISSKPVDTKVDLWEFIVEHFRKQFCFVFFEKALSYDFYPLSTTPKEESLKNGEYVTSNENIFVEKIHPPKLYIHLHKYFQNLWIYPQVKQGTYRYLHFKDIGPGLLVLDDIAIRPQYIFFAAINGAEVYEAIAVDLLRFLDKSLKKR